MNLSIMMKKLNLLITITTLVLINFTLSGQSTYRTILQAKVDSLVKPYEDLSGTKIQSDMSFKFNEEFQGIMKNDGSMYTQQGSIEYKKGDTISLYKASLVGGLYVSGKLSTTDKEPYFKNYKIKSEINLLDSIGFWKQFDLVKKIKAKDFAQYHVALRCDTDNYSKFEKLERMFVNSEKNLLAVRLLEKDEKLFLVFALDASHGNELKGLGCAEDDKAYLEVKFDDGTSIKRQNKEYEYCQSLHIDITDDIDKFRQGIVELKISMSKKKHAFKIEDPFIQNQINLKLDCITNTNE